MPYINITEYDNTITGPKTYNGNVVVVPINANDGPSDRWVTVHRYDDFVQMFGDNPNTSSDFGNSWEYAANLLLRGMAVCVRRITNYLSDEGTNLELLPDVSVAKAVVKVKDVIGSDTADLGTLTKGDITLTDSLEHSKLKASNKGEEIPNDLYKDYTYEEDGTTKHSPYANTHVLQSDETNRVVGAFADVLSTESEWNFVGEFDNPHYKYQKAGDTTPMNYIYTMDQLNDAGGNPYVVGDFFINESNHVVKFSSTPILNEFWISGQKQYPDDLKSVKTDGLTEEHFVDVTFDKDNKKAVNLVWTYSSQGTKVANHKFINGTITVDGNTKYKLFETNADLPTENIGVNYFAPVQSTETIWVYNGSVWSNTGAAFSSLTDTNSDYSMEVTIPFKCTKKAINTDIYKHYFNWINTGEEVYIDIEHPEFAYLPKLYWVNSENKIGSRPHVVLSGADIVINDININTMADASKTTLKVIVNGYQDINIDTDYTDTRLISGNFGITNDGTEAIRIYGLQIIQKAENGETTLVYDAGLDKIINSSGRITTDSLLKIYNNTTNTYLTDPIPMLDSTTTEDKWYIELDPNCTIYYNRNLTGGVFKVRVAGFENFIVKCSTFDTANGSYTLTATDKSVMEVNKYYIPSIIDEKIDYTKPIPVHDANQNFNLFIAEYINPGVNGNFLNVRINTIANQGIYLYVYRNKQYLEKVELCSFRFKNSTTGRVNIFDMELNKDDIWKIILAKFGVLLFNDGKAYDNNRRPITDDSQLVSIYGNYIKINLNPEVVKNGNPSSLDYVYSLYAQNGSVITSLEGGKNPDDEHIIHEVAKCYGPLKDKYKYDIKFVTNGAYIDKITYPKDIIHPLATDTSVRLIEDAMLDLVNSRKDCVSYLDVPYDLPLEDVPYYFEHISTSYAAAYDPWGLMILGTGSSKWMPPSFVQLYTHAKSIQNGNKLYLPPAGVRRAQVPEILTTNHELPSSYIETWQNETTPQFINPIIWINGYDYTIYGQKTLYNIINESDKYQSALQDLNVRLVANEIKKLIFKTCIELTFELNNIMTWNEFKSKLEPNLSVMQGEGVLTEYNVMMGTETMTSADLNSGHISGKVQVSIARAATDWDIDFELTPNGVTFTEYDYSSRYSD